MVGAAYSDDGHEGINEWRLRDRCRPRPFLAILTAGFLLLVGNPPLAGADWNSFSQYSAVAEARLEQGSITVLLRIKQSALPGYVKQLGVADVDPRLIAARLLAFRDFADRPLNAVPAVVRQITPNPAETATDPYVEAKLNIELEGEPQVLIVAPAPGFAANALGLVVLHKGVPIADLFALDKPAKMRLDWTNPWRSRFDDTSLIRRHAEPRTYSWCTIIRHCYMVRNQGIDLNKL